MTKQNQPRDERTLLRRIATLEKRIATLETAARASHTSISGGTLLINDGGRIVINDSGGTKRIEISPDLGGMRLYYAGGHVDITTGTGLDGSGDPAIVLTAPDPDDADTKTVLSMSADLVGMWAMVAGVTRSGAYVRGSDGLTQAYTCYASGRTASEMVSQTAGIALAAYPNSAGADVAAQLSVTPDGHVYSFPAIETAP